MFKLLKENLHAPVTRHFQTDRGFNLTEGHIVLYKQNNEF